jgi:hypothetical protein
MAFFAWAIPDHGDAQMTKGSNSAVVEYARAKWLARRMFKNAETTRVEIIAIMRSEGKNYAIPGLTDILTRRDVIAISNHTKGRTSHEKADERRRAQENQSNHESAMERVAEGASGSSTTEALTEDLVSDRIRRDVERAEFTLALRHCESCDEAGDPARS